MSRPPHPYISLPFPGGDPIRFWPPFLLKNEQPDLIFQLERPPPFKRLRNSEELPRFAPLPPIIPRTNPSNAPGNKGTGHMFYKTRICAKFMERTCRNGANCTFAHGVQDLREPPSNWQEILREKERRGGVGSSSSGEEQRMGHRLKSSNRNSNGEEFGFRGKRDFFQERSSSPRPTKFKPDDMPRQRESFAISVGTSSDSRGKRNFRTYDQIDCRFKNPAADHLEDRKGRTDFLKRKVSAKWERGQGSFGERCHFTRGNSSELKFTGTRVEAKVVVDSNSVPAKPMSVSVLRTAASLLVDPQAGEDKRTSKWKLNRKINRIYADWLDDQTPPYRSPSKEDT